MVKIKDSYNNDALNIYFSKISGRSAELVLEFDYPKDKLPTVTSTIITLDEMLNLRDLLNEMIGKIVGLREC